MTAKSVIQIDVDSSQFRDFYALYQDYQAKLENMPDDWKATGDAINDANGAMQEFAEATGGSKEALVIAATQAEVISKEIRKASEANKALLEGIWKNTRAQKDFSDETERGNQSLKKMKENAEGVASSVFGIGKWLLKLGAWGVGLAGLGGILSGIGLKDLAESAVDTQRGARGLGMTPGQLTAFNQDYSRYVDQSALGSIANSQNSYAGRMWLARASGEGVNQVAGEDPGQLAGQLALRAHDWWAKTPENMRTAENLQSSGFSQSGFSLEMMRQLGNTPRSELERAQSQYKQDQGRFNVGDQNTDAWYGFLRQIKDAGNTIETELKNRLVALAPNLQHFVDVLGKDAMKLIDDIFTPQNLKALENGIDAFVTYLGSGGFKQDMKDFADLVSEVVGSLRSTAKFLNIGGDSTTPDKTVSTLTPAAPGTAPSSTEIALGKARHFLTSPSSENARAYLAALDQKNGLPAGALEAQWSKESGEGSSIVGPALKSGDQAIGDFQFTSAAWKDWGKGGDRFNFKDEANSAGAYMSFLMKRYKGDIKEALAAYDWGPGNVDKAISQNGSNWQNSLPRETRDYINKIASALKAKPIINVNVTNNTSARVAVQANAAAAQ